MERQPVKTIPIHEHLRPRLCDTYENDSIFDKFEVVFSGDAKNVMTGSYNNNFMIYPSEEGMDTEVVLQADKSAFKAKKVGIPTPMNLATSPGGGRKESRANSPAGGAQRMRKETDADQFDFNKKILHMGWHPQEDSIAIAATNNVSFLILPHLNHGVVPNPRIVVRLLCTLALQAVAPPAISTPSSLPPYQLARGCHYWQRMRSHAAFRCNFPICIAAQRGGSPFRCSGGVGAFGDHLADRAVEPNPAITIMINAEDEAEGMEWTV